MAEILNEIGYGFKDVTLLPGTGPLEGAPNSTQPENFDLSIRIAGDIYSHTPWITSNMTTVTDRNMALRAARLGVLPVLPQFQPIENRIAIVTNLREQDIDTQKYPDANVDKDKQLIIAAAVGYDRAVPEAIELAKAGASIIVFDSASAHTPGFIEKTEKVCDEIKRFRDSPEGSTVAIVAGNVGTAEGAEDLFKAGTDAVKAGIATGAACATGPETAVSVPPVSCGLWTVPVAEHYGGTVWLDGGVRDRYDGVIAASIAHGVMGGYIFVGTDAAPMQFTRHQKRYGIYRGSASPEARKVLEEQFPELYPQRDYKAPEGLNGAVHIKGSLEDMVMAYNRALRTTMWYVRVRNLTDLRIYAKLLPLSQASQYELQKKTLVKLINDDQPSDVVSRLKQAVQIIFSGAQYV